MRPPLSPSIPRTRDSRGAYAALGISAAAHGVLALVIAVAPRAPDRQVQPAPSRAAEHVAYMEIGAPGAYAVPAPAGGVPASTRAVPPDASPAGAARPSREVNSPAVPPDSGGAAGPAPAAPTGVEAATRPVMAGAGTGTRAARLGPEYGDPRLVIVPPTLARMLSDAARYEAQFRAAWRAFGDSIQHAADRERLAASWTWRDPRGRAWGVRDGVLFMDGQRIMAMEMFGDRDQDRAARIQSSARREIARQAEDIERDRYLQERQRAISARRDQERRSARP